MGMGLKLGRGAEPLSREHFYKLRNEMLKFGACFK
jgi:hypothetical protein